jgi:hypothetical protein
LYEMVALLLGSLPEVSVDTAGNESDPSNAATAASDRTAPWAMIIAYEPQGPHDPLSGRTAPGLVNVRLTVNEPLITTRFLSLTPHGGVPMPVDLTAVTPTEYQGLAGDYRHHPNRHRLCGLFRPRFRACFERQCRNADIH